MRRYESREMGGLVASSLRVAAAAEGGEAEGGHHGVVVGRGGVALASTLLVFWLARAVVSERRVEGLEAVWFALVEGARGVADDAFDGGGVAVGSGVDAHGLVEAAPQ